MSFLLVRSCGRAVAIALGDVLEVVRTVAMAEPDGVRWRGRFGRFDWRGLRVSACELAPRLDGARPRRLADYVDGHIVLAACADGVVGWVVERAETIVEHPGEAALVRPLSLLGVRERRRFSVAPTGSLATG
jgi:CheW-like protein